MELQIRESPLGGKGTFTKRTIKEGSLIKTLSGEKISLEEVIKRINNGKENKDDPLQVGEDIFLDLDEPSRQINHSCEPNCCLKDVSDLVAIKDIKPGEELTYDYSATVSKNISSKVWSMTCNCSSQSCRHSISNVLTIPSERLKKYQEEGKLQKYILNELNELG